MPHGNRDAKVRNWTEEAILALVEGRVKRLIRRALNGADGGIGGADIDHGALLGLTDDDHAGYLLDASGTGGDGIDVTARVVTVDLATDPGLEFSGGEVRVLVGDGLERVAAGIQIDLAATPGLEFSTGDLTAKVGDGLELTASGIEIDLAANPGLEFVTGDLTLDLAAQPIPLELTAGGLAFLVGDGLEVLASDPNNLQVEAVTSAGVEVTASGLQADGTVTMANTNQLFDYTVLLSDCIISLIPVVGNIAVTVPVYSTAGFTGKVFTFKRTSGGANTVTINRSSTDTFDGATSISLPNQYDSVTIANTGGIQWAILSTIP